MSRQERWILSDVQLPQCVFVIEPVSGLGHLCRLQKPDGVVMVERAHTHTGDPADFFDCLHGHPSRLTIV